MDALPRFDEILALGRKLIDQLGKDPPPDTLSRWMAHYVAELIDAAENDPPAESDASRRRCFEAILELWSHRADLPGGKRPFEDLEPIARALESLDPNNEKLRFFASVRRAVAKAEEGAQTRSLLEFVDGVDYSARIIIVHALADAARAALDKSREWVALAEEAGRSPRFVGLAIDFVATDVRLDDQAEEVERERELLVERIERLESFSKLAAVVSDDLKQRLDALPPPSDSTGGSVEDVLSERNSGA